MRQRAGSLSIVIPVSRGGRRQPWLYGFIHFFKIVLSIASQSKG